jgi:multiple sugar transport system permease protein
MEKMSQKKRRTTTVVTIVAFVILVVELLPIAIVFINGFKKDLDVVGGNPFEIKFTLTSYKKVLSKEEFPRGLKNSLLVGLLSTGVSVVVGSMASYGIARFKFRGRQVLSYSFLVSRMIPQISLVVALYMMFKTIGNVFAPLSMRNSLVPLILSHCTFNIPYIIWMLLPFFISIPKDYEEAAFVDGCNRRQVFWRIFFPLVAPGIVVASVFSFIMSWNEFLYALVLTGMKTKTAPIVITGFMGQFMPMWGQISAAGTLMLIPVFIFTLALQRFIVQGLTAGGIKG